MDIHVERLSQIVQYRHEVEEVPDWTRMEEEFSIPFPADFRDFARIFGAGLLDDYISITIPWPGNGFIDLIQSSNDFLETLRGVRDTLPAEMTYPLESRVGGLILWGANEDTDLCFWIPEGAPNQWRTGVYSRTFNDWTEYQCGFAEFLVGVVSGEIESPFAASDFPSQRPLFKSWHQRLDEALDY
jgi:hypothetical protein